jgi:acyl carrier protein
MGWNNAMGLDAVKLIVEAEEHFGVSVSDAQLEETATVEQFAQLLCDLASTSESPITYEAVLLQLQQIVSKMFNIPIDDIVPGAHFVNDLGLSQ